MLLVLERRVCTMIQHFLMSQRRFISDHEFQSFYLTMGVIFKAWIHSIDKSFYSHLMPSQVPLLFLCDFKSFSAFVAFTWRWISYLFPCRENNRNLCQALSFTMLKNRFDEYSWRTFFSVSLYLRPLDLMTSAEKKGRLELEHEWEIFSVYSPTFVSLISLTNLTKRTRWIHLFTYLYLFISVPDKTFIDFRLISIRNVKVVIKFAENIFMWLTSS